MENLGILEWLAFILVIVGGINWGLIGLFDFNLVSFLFGSMTTASRTVYSLVGLSALYMAFLPSRLKVME
ncbi:MAG: DUF378 domain-containing protein [Halanaerobiales bacterium]